MIFQSYNNWERTCLDLYTLWWIVFCFTGEYSLCTFKTMNNWKDLITSATIDRNNIFHPKTFTVNLACMNCKLALTHNLTDRITMMSLESLSQLKFGLLNFSSTRLVLQWQLQGNENNVVKVNIHPCQVGITLSAMYFHYFHSEQECSKVLNGQLLSKQQK